MELLAVRGVDPGMRMKAKKRIADAQEEAALKAEKAAGPYTSSFTGCFFAAQL